jgi:hypothetical protein
MPKSKFDEQRKKERKKERKTNIERQSKEEK